MFLDYKFCLTIDSKFGTARLAREPLARKKLPAGIQPKKLGLSMMRLQREDGTRAAIAESPKTNAADPSAEALRLANNYFEVFSFMTASIAVRRPGGFK
jgi:hypothetical protein